MPTLRRRYSPDWSSLSGGDSSAGWQVDRKRKARRIALSGTEIIDLADELASCDALYKCTPEILKEIPSSGKWYISLACYSQKTRKSSVSEVEELYGSIDTFLKHLHDNPLRIGSDQLQAFSNWVNKEINEVFPNPPSDQRLYAVYVSMIEGGRIIGQGQNEGGSAAVSLLKSALINSTDPENWQYIKDDLFVPAISDLEDAYKASTLKYLPSDTIINLQGGGNKPDIKVSRGKSNLLVGEIKGRKDLSNTWESWMPQVADHLRTWKSEYPGSYSCVFMTVLTEEMIEGASKQGTARTGLKGLHKDGLLDFAFNISALADPTTAQYESFKGLFENLLRR
jgi:hypothetical protein